MRDSITKKSLKKKRSNSKIDQYVQRSIGLSPIPQNSKITIFFKKMNIDGKCFAVKVKKIHKNSSTKIYAIDQSCLKKFTLNLPNEEFSALIDNKSLEKILEGLHIEGDNLSLSVND